MKIVKDAKVQGQDLQQCSSSMQGCKSMVNICVSAPDTSLTSTPLGACQTRSAHWHCHHCVVGADPT